MIRLPPDKKDAVRIEGEEAYPDECCGFLLGTLEKDGLRNVVEILPVANARERKERHHRFHIDADDFMRAERQARSGELDIVGFYHSHPDHPAEPSEYDREHALPFYSYVIVAVSKGIARELTSWELLPDRSRFNQEY
ncbi:MAG: M67 family metallopeptidase [Desulfovibrio sp.]|jgi:proteasome lid subunit RPN8/RPN11|nr:M67 family metallopeptidase [Desulfovibrio sp.]